MASMKHNGTVRDFLSYLRFGGPVERYRCHGDKKKKVVWKKDVEKFDKGFKELKGVYIPRKAVAALFNLNQDVDITNTDIQDQAAGKLRGLLKNIGESLGIGEELPVTLPRSNATKDFFLVRLDHPQLPDEGRRKFAGALILAVKKTLESHKKQIPDLQFKVLGNGNFAHQVTQDFFDTHLVKPDQHGGLEKHVNNLVHMLSVGWKDGQNVKVDDMKNTVQTLFGAQKSSAPGSTTGNTPSDEGGVGPPKPDPNRPGALVETQLTIPFASYDPSDQGQPNNGSGTTPPATSNTLGAGQNNQQTQPPSTTTTAQGRWPDPGRFDKSLTEVHIPTAVVKYIGKKQGLSTFINEPEKGVRRIFDAFMPLLHKSGINVTGYETRNVDGKEFIVAKLGRSGTNVSPNVLSWTFGTLQGLLNRWSGLDKYNSKLAIRFGFRTDGGQTQVLPYNVVRQFAQFEIKHGRHLGDGGMDAILGKMKDYLAASERSVDNIYDLYDVRKTVGEVANKNMQQLYKKSYDQELKSELHNWFTHTPIASINVPTEHAERFVSELNAKLRKDPKLQFLRVTEHEKGSNPHDASVRSVSVVLDHSVAPDELRAGAPKLDNILAHFVGSTFDIARKYNANFYYRHSDIATPDLTMFFPKPTSKTGVGQKAQNQLTQQTQVGPGAPGAPQGRQVTPSTNTQQPETTEGGSGEAPGHPAVASESTGGGRVYRTTTGYVFDPQYERAHISSSKRALKNIQPSDHFNHGIFVSHEYLEQNPGFEKFLKNIASNYSDVIQGFRRRRTRQGYVYDLVFHGQGDQVKDPNTAVAQARSVMARLSTALAGFHYQLAQSTGRHFDNDHFLVKVNGQRFDLGSPRQRQRLANLAYLSNEPSYHQQHFVWGQEMAQKYLQQRELERPFLDRVMWGAPGAIKRGVGRVLGGVSRATGSVLSGLGNLLKRAGGGGEQTIPTGNVQFSRKVAQFKAGGGLRGFHPPGASKALPPTNKPPVGVQPGVGRFPGVLPGVVSGAKFPQLAPHTAGPPSHTSGGDGGQGAPLQHWLTQQHQEPGALVSAQVPVHYERPTGDVWGRGSGTVLPAQTHGGSDDISFTHAVRVPPSTRGWKGQGPLAQRYPALMFLAKRVGERVLLHHDKVR